jgi:hypothetical protein
MIKNDTKQYVWIRPNGDIALVTDPVAAWQSPEFDKDEDRMFVLGNEVEVNFTIVEKNKTVFRSYDPTNPKS